MFKIIDIFGAQRTRKVGGWVPAMMVLAGLEAFTIASFMPFKLRCIFESQVEIASELVERYLRAPFLFHLETNSSILIRTITKEVRIGFGSVLSPLMLLLTALLVVASAARKAS